MRYNFASKTKEKNNLESIKLTQKPFTNSASKVINLYIFQKLRKHYLLYCPPLFISLISLTLYIFTIPSTVNIRRLQENQDKFLLTSNQIQLIYNKLSRRKQQVTQYDSFYLSRAPVYLFAFYLQNTIPDNVRLINYSLDDKSFKLTATSNNIRSLNQLVELLSASPLITKETLYIYNLSANKQVPFNSNINQTKDSTTSIEVKGLIKPLDISSIKSLYKESFAMPHLNKLYRYESILSLLEDF